MGKENGRYQLFLELTTPVKNILFRKMNVRDDSIPNSVGRVPVKKFDPTLSTLRLAIRLSVEGTVPVSLLCSRTRNAKAARLPSCDGI